MFMEFTKGVTYYVKMKKGKIVDFYLGNTIF